MSDHARLDHASLSDKRHTTLQRAYTIQATAKCRENVEVRWSNRYKNWRIYWKGKLRGEFLTGEKFKIDKVVEMIRDIKNCEVKQKFKAYRDAKEYKKKKSDEATEDRSRDMAKDWVAFGGRGRKSFKIGK